MDSLTGALVDTLPLTSASLTGVQLSPDRTQLLYGSWNGSEEKMVAIDVTTGQATEVGTVGDLLYWSGQTVINPADETMLFWGSNGTTDKLYVLDIATGAELRSVPLTTGVQAPRMVY